MSLTRLRFLLGVAAITAALGVPVRAQLISGHESLIAKHNPFRPFDSSQPVTVAELCKWIDCVGEELRDDGLVVMKQPDVFSQARLTRYRTDFETQMSNELSTFHLVLAARINRLDAATTTSQTALSGALSPGSTTVAIPTLPTLPTSTATGAPANGSIGLPLTGPFTTPSTGTGGLGIASNTLAGSTAANSGNLALGVEPTVYLDEKKRFLEHLNQIRRISLGPDQNDSSGYGLYLVRLPVSITPGECTYSGFGADFSVQVEHEFPPEFLPTTFESLVINDLVDELGPFIYEVIRSGLLKTLKTLEDAKTQKKALLIKKNRLLELLLTGLAQRMANGAIAIAKQKSIVNPVDPFVTPLADFILRESQPPTNDPVQDKQSWKAIADRLSVVAEARAKFRAGYEDQDQDFDQNLAEFRTKIEAVREGNGLDGTLKTTVIEYLRAILTRFLETGYLQSQLFRQSIDRLADPSQTQLLNWGAFRPFISNLYSTALPDDIKTLDDLLRVDETQRSTITAPLASINNTLGTMFDSYQDQLNLNLTSTRSAKQLYPIAPRELIKFFLEDNVYLIAKDAQEALRTATPRASEIRNYLRHTLQTAYWAMKYNSPRQVDPPALAPLADAKFMQDVHDAIRERQFTSNFERDSVLKTLNDQLVARLELSRDNIKRKPIGALCWAIAVDAAVLDAALRSDTRKVFETNGMPPDMIDSVRFYLPKDQPNDMARAIFNDYVKLRWPIITFSLDPVTDQQNIADSFNLKRDLQLAVSFAFATGQIGFNQLNTFRRQIEQSSDTVALNRTVTGFTHGNDIFGFRFSPRFQNPPNQRTNVGVIASQLIGGGPGPDYQIKKSKLEAGMREQTAVLLIPTFLPTMRMNVAGNWFKLNDPEHLVFHTNRMMERGRKVQELRKAVLDACSAQQYRGADLRVLQSKLAQLEAMLPMQSKVVQLPFDNLANGFDLFSEGATALVPELTGFTGIDVIQPPATPATQTAVQLPAATPAAGTPAATPASSSGITITSNTTTSSSTTSTVSTVGGTGSIADVFITGKYLSILDTKVIAGGRSAAFEILSREVVHVQIPTGVTPTKTEDGNFYVEVYMSTPNGVSNSILIPYAAPAPPSTVVYDVDKGSQTIDVFYQWLTTPDGTHSLVPTADPGKGIKITWNSPVAFVPKTLQATFTVTVGTQAVTIALPTDTGTASDYSVDLQAFVVTLLQQLQQSTTFPTPLPATATVSVSVQPFTPDPSAGFRVRSDAIKLQSTITLNLNYNATGTNALPQVFPVRIPTPTPAPKGNTTSLRTPRPGLGGAGQEDPNLIRTAEQLPSFSLPPLPTTFSIPKPPDLLSVPSLLPSASSAEAEQVARLLTGQPLLPNAAPPTLAGIQALAPNLAAAAAAIPTTIPALPAAGPASPIIVMPAPVVVVGPKAAPKPKHKSLFHRSRMFNDKGQRTDQ